MGTSLFEFINERYLLGISDEPKQLLQPITGYAYEPLLPLEEACEPLLDIVPRLPAHIWIAKQNSKAPADGLTRDESAAIRLYTMEWDAAADEPRGSLYVHLNRTLKKVDRTELRPWFRYLKLFLTALAKLPAAPRQTVWRGIRKDHSVDYPPGEEATWWAFSSCTTSLSVLESDLYLGKTGTRTLFSIEAINARTISSHSHFTAEDEILLLPGTYFVVKSRLNPAPELHIIHLQQQVPPYPLLEPPFEGAELLPPPDIDRTKRRSTVDDNFRNVGSRPWYKKNKIRFGIGAIIAIIITAIILGAVLGTRSDTKTTTSPTITTTPISILYNGTAPNPLSVADAFYSFDGNTLDLYSRRNGIVVGGSVSYIQGYVAYGRAIVFDQTTPTQININPSFNLYKNTSFTIEGFFMLYKTQLNAILIQLTPSITFNISNGILMVSLGVNQIIPGHQTISTEQWHHLSFVYNAIEQTGTISIDGDVEITNSSITPDILPNSINSTIIVGAGYSGCIDQLSITLKAKSQSVIQWDATTAGYYRMDMSWLQDSGPNGINATANSVQSVYAWRYNGLNFNESNAYFQVDGFTALGAPFHPFSISLWVRAETQPGVLLTVYNPSTCLLVLGLRNDNKLVAYLPNATAAGTSATIVGPEMDLFHWINVVFTWSYQSGAKLYTSTYIQGSNTDTKSLTNTRGENNSLPMSITLGKYNGGVNCGNIQGINASQQFMGSMDEFFVFAREIGAADMTVLTQTLPT